MFQGTEHSAYLEPAIQPATETNSSRKDTPTQPNPAPSPMPCSTSRHPETPYSPAPQLHV